MPARSGPLSPDNVAIPFKLRLNGEVLSFISTTMIFGTPVDVTLSELALETFFPGRRSDRAADAGDRGGALSVPLSSRTHPARLRFTARVRPSHTRRMDSRSNKHAGCPPIPSAISCAAGAIAAP